MWGPLMMGFWWIFPVLGLVMFLGCLLMMIRSAAGGHGCMCMGGHRGTHTADASGTRRE